MSPPSVPDGIKILTIAELTRQVKGLLDDAFPSVWVAGQVSNCKPATSGHIYLCLKDAEAQIRAVIWRGTAMRLRFDPKMLKDGVEVVARGRLDVYSPHGEYKLVIEEVHLRGVGALELAFQKLKEKLFRLGYFDPKRKRPLPAIPQRVALVTSPTGAAVRDMLQILLRRWPCLEVWVCPVQVQGEGAAEDIANAIAMLNRCEGLDVLIVGRGGGSLEDLWAFNEECVAHAIYQSRIPVVSAVGHEIDETIADKVADRRAATPSEAAEIVVPDREEQLGRVDWLRQQLRQRLLRRVELARDRLRTLAERRPLRHPLERLREREQQLDGLGQRLQRAKQQQLNRLRERLQAQAARLETLSPLNVLARGYSLTCSAAEGTVVRSPEQVRPGDLLVTRLQHGRLFSRVVEPPASGSVTEDTSAAGRVHD